MKAAQIFVSKRTQLSHSIVHIVCTVWVNFGIAFEAASCPWIDLVTVFIATRDQFDLLTLVNYLQMQRIEVEIGIRYHSCMIMKRRVILWKKNSGHIQLFQKFHKKDNNQSTSKKTLSGIDSKYFQKTRKKNMNSLWKKNNYVQFLRVRPTKTQNFRVIQMLCIDSHYSLKIQIIRLKGCQF